MVVDIGKKIKNLRTDKGLTLRTLGDKTGYSIGFLSQLERGLTTVAVDALQTIAQALEVDMTVFFVAPEKKPDLVIRRYERPLLSKNENHFVDFALSNDISDKTMLPRLIEINPHYQVEHVESYVHEGEEFIFVLEGVLTVVIDQKREDMYPGDSLHIKSDRAHNWHNYTPGIVRLLAVHTPNKFYEDK